MKKVEMTELRVVDAGRDAALTPDDLTISYNYKLTNFGSLLIGLQFIGQGVKLGWIFTPDKGPSFTSEDLYAFAGKVINKIKSWFNYA